MSQVGKLPKVIVPRGGDAYCEVGTSEDPDWGFARDLQLILKDSLVEYSTSSFDAPVQTPLGTFHGGNRDFTWQGLLVGPLEGRLYKVLDAVHYRPLDAGSEALTPISVKVWRTSASFYYSYEDGRSYRVDVSVRADRRRARLMLRATRPTEYLPLFDLRDAERPGARPTYDISRGEGEGTPSVKVRSDASPLEVKVEGFDTSRELGSWISWSYKLDDGFRAIDGGSVVFVRHSADLYAPLALESSSGRLDVDVQLPVQGTAPERCPSRAAEKLKALRGSLRAPPEVSDAILLRMNTLLSFGVPVDGISIPEAGAFWFRRAWSRDAIEGLRWNARTYADVLGCSRWLSDVVGYLLGRAVEDGGLRVLVGSTSGEYASDAFPQLLNVALSAYKLTGDRDLLTSATRAASAAASALTSASGSSAGFSGCALQDGLIVCRANSSWMDATSDVGGIRWPLRLPLSWIGSADPGGLYALLEVNALYIEAYSRLLGVLAESQEAVPGELAELRSELLDGYRRRFYSSSSLPPLTYDPSSGRVDGTKSSAGVLALAVLKGIAYGRDELAAIWHDVEGLLVSRRLVALGEGTMPFGVVARDVDRRPYLGDLEYHGYVVWPRDTPYLVEVMRALSMDVKGILVNNLDHMVSEGAVGYSAELFSLPLGANPSPSGERSENPVPVKDPVQYWSHWCDPYLDEFGGIGGGDDA